MLWRYDDWYPDIWTYIILEIGKIAMNFSSLYIEFFLRTQQMKNN